VLEDAPRPTLIGFLKGILVSIVGNNETYGSRTRVDCDGLAIELRQMFRIPLKHPVRLTSAA
jgi:hypothetical protein